MNLTLVLPVYNEEKLIEKNTDMVVDFLKRSRFITKFEVLLCNNGSTDSTLLLAKKLQNKYSEVRAFSINKKGMGVGAVLGLKNAKYDNLMIYSIDFCFGLDIINELMSNMDHFDIIIGSKGHLKSIVKISKKRMILSKIYNLLLNNYFKLGVKDTQGITLIKKDALKKIISYLNSSDAFLTAQIIIYGRLKQLSMREIPVNYINLRKDSKINPIRDGLRMFIQIIKESKRYKKIKKDLER